MKQRGLPGFHYNILFSLENANLSTSLVPFLPSLSELLKPSDTFL
jgi:hypothetical protein